MRNTKATPEKAVAGLFREHENAELGYQALRALGYREQDLSVLLSSETRESFFLHPVGRSSYEPQSSFEAGALVGGIVAALVSHGTTVVLPGLVLVVAGPLVGGFVHAKVGAPEILVSVLRGLGLSEARAGLYDQGLRAGAVLLSVVPKHAEAARQAGNALHQAHGEWLYD